MTNTPSLLRFILVLPRLSSAGDFSLKDLPGSGQRVDILCRALSACFDWGPSTWNKDGLQLAAVINDQLTLVFARPPSNVHMGEKAWAKVIKDSLRGAPPSFVERKEIGLAVFIEEVMSSSNSQTWAMDEHGEEIVDTRVLEPIQENNIIIGDQKGYDEKAKRTLAEHSIYRISLGEISYLSSHCVAAIIALFERMEK